jgi:hypothetical protein
VDGGVATARRRGVEDFIGFVAGGGRQIGRSALRAPLRPSAERKRPADAAIYGTAEAVPLSKTDLQTGQGVGGWGGVERREEWRGGRQPQPASWPGTTVAQACEPSPLAGDPGCPPHGRRPVRGDPGCPPHGRRPVRGDPGCPPHGRRPVRGDPGSRLRAMHPYQNRELGTR